MKFKVENGTNIISIGYCSIGSYLKIRKPVSLVWEDDYNTLARYVCLLPYAESMRYALHSAILDILYEDFTEREAQLCETLHPLFALFENGEYQLEFKNGKDRLTNTLNLIYPEIVDLNRSAELKDRYREIRQLPESQRFRENIVGFTSTWIEELWEDEKYIATQPFSAVNKDRVKFYEQRIAEGERPFAILMNAASSSTQDYSADFVLDGHHKLEAYKNLGIYPPHVVITCSFDTVNKLEFDLESLAAQLYPWQMQDLINNWDDNDTRLEERLEFPDSLLHQFIKNGLITEYYENDKLKSESFYTNNKLNGRAIGWYENGNLQYERFFKNGYVAGMWKEYYPSGQINRLTSYDDRWLQHGEILAYHENGQMLRKEQFKHGKYEDGLSFQMWHENGNKSFERNYLNDQVIEKKDWDLDGILIGHEVYDEAQKRLVVKRVTNSATYSERGKPNTSKKNMNIIKRRQYPETNFKISWRWVAILLIVLLQLLRTYH